MTAAAAAAPAKGSPEYGRVQQLFIALCIERQVSDKDQLLIELDKVSARPAYPLSKLTEFGKCSRCSTQLKSSLSCAVLLSTHAMLGFTLLCWLQQPSCTVTMLQ